MQMEHVFYDKSRFYAKTPFSFLCFAYLFVSHGLAHSEALTSILLFLKRVEPSQELLKHIISRDVKEGDSFVVSVLKFWTSNEAYEKKLAELLSSSLSKSSSPVKR